MRRIPDVLDCWFESGSMPYAQMHYPFENQDKFEHSFPANFIAEGIDQTRAWFYYLHVLSTGIKNSISFRNVVVNGIVLAEDGKKMSKRLQNYPDPSLMMEKYGSDVLRFYLMSSPVVAAENLNFSEKELAELSRGMFRMLWNTYSFFTLYANIDKWQPDKANSVELSGKNLLDRWIISELNILAKNVNESMEKYELNKAARHFPAFIDNLSNWYVRRSRRRFWKSESDQDKNDAYQTLWYVLVQLSKLIAPFCPFIADEIHKNLTSRESVHLDEYPQVDDAMIDQALSEKMRKVRLFTNEGLRLRAEAGRKVRQPLYLLTVNEDLGAELLDIIKDEVNVKEVKVDTSLELIRLNITLDEDLILEGQMRELVRQIQEARKEAGFEVDNRIKLWYKGGSLIFEKFQPEIAKEVLAESINSAEEDIPDADLHEAVKIDGNMVEIWLKKV